MKLKMLFVFLSLIINSCRQAMNTNIPEYNCQALRAIGEPCQQSDSENYYRFWDINPSYFDTIITIQRLNEHAMVTQKIIPHHLTNAQILSKVKKVKYSATTCIIEKEALDSLNRLHIALKEKYILDTTKIPMLDANFQKLETNQNGVYHSYYYVTPNESLANCLNYLKQLTKCKESANY